MMNLFLFFISFGMLLFAIESQAEKVFSNQEYPQVLDDDRSQSILLGGGYSSVHNTGQSLSGLHFGVGYQYGYTTELGIQIGVNQTIDLDNLGSLSTDYTGSFLYAVRGSLKRTQRMVAVDHVPVLERKTISDSVLAMRVGYIQVLYGGSSSVVSLPGFIVGGIYSLPRTNSLDFTASLDYIATKSGSREVSQFRASIGLAFWP